MKKLLVTLVVLFPFVAVSVEMFKGAPITSLALYLTIVTILVVTVVVAWRRPTTRQVTTKNPVW
ncbi:MAG: hypothetical protein ACK46D_09255 [Roseiflexaceae bacterium]